jgi:cell division transport system ATP-binding protein
MVFLTGHSGAGKSTLLRLILMLERPSRGLVLVDGRNLGKTPSRLAPQVRRRIGMIFQDHKLLGDKSVFDNVALPLLIAGMRYTDIRKRVRAALDKVGLLGKEKSWPPTLSGGEQQRVGIARAIVGMPPILLADEPTGNLDPETSGSVMDFLTELNNEGRTIVMVTHDPNVAHRANRTLRIVEGTIREDNVREALHVIG